MKLLLTGGYGYVGQWLIDHLKKKYDVTVLARQIRPNFVLNDVPKIEADITDIHSLTTTLSGLQFHTVIHLASANDYFEDNYSEKALRVNALGTKNILRVVQSLDVKHFIYFSTFHVYGITHGMITEEMSPMPTSDYGLTHWIAEEYIRMANRNWQLPFTVIRMTNAYGHPKQTESGKWYLVVNDLAKMAIENKEIRLKSNGNSQRDFIPLQTVCEVTDSMIQQGPLNGIFNLSGENNYTMLDIAKWVKAAYYEFSAEDIPIFINENDHTPKSTQPIKVSSSKLKAVIPYHAPNLIKEEAIKIFNLVTKH